MKIKKNNVLRFDEMVFFLLVLKCILKNKEQSITDKRTNHLHLKDKPKTVSTQ
jgi:hypothetical protein